MENEINSKKFKNIFIAGLILLVSVCVVVVILNSQKIQNLSWWYQISTKWSVNNWNPMRIELPLSIKTDTLDCKNREFFVPEQKVEDRIPNITDAVMSNYFLVQNGEVLYRTGFEGPFVPLVGADAFKIEFIGSEYYLRDDDQVWYISWNDGLYSHIGMIVQITEADVDTFTFIGSGYLEGYAKDKKNVYYTYMTVREADPKSASVISYGNALYLMDASRVYYNGMYLQDSDPDSFQVLKDKSLSLGVLARDADNMYMYQNKIDGADAVSIKLCSNSYLMDKNSVLFFWSNGHRMRMVDGVSPETFKILVGSSGQYGKDKNNVYRYGELLPDADPDTFSLGQGLYYAADHKNVWNVHTKNTREFDPVKTIKGVHLETFQDLGGGYGKDVYNVYFEGEKILGADVSTFFIPTDGWDGWGVDKNQYYRNGVVTSLRPLFKRKDE